MVPPWLCPPCVEMSTSCLSLTLAQGACAVPVSPALAERITQTVEITKHVVDIEEKGVKLRLTIVDTPGFGDAVNNTEWCGERDVGALGWPWGQGAPLGVRAALRQGRPTVLWFVQPLSSGR